MTRAVDFRARQKNINQDIKRIENDMQNIIKETERVQGIAANASEIISDLDRQFEKQTGLTGKDIQFLFIATFLQVVRWWCLDNTKLRISSSAGDVLTAKCVPKTWENILLSSVPYDAISNISGVDTGLSGTTHRYRTLGHDPILGWIFGPINILSDSLTKSNVITTYSVQDMKIIGMYSGGTLGAINQAILEVKRDKYNLPAAVLKQALHFSSDAFTKQGLPIPFLGTIAPDVAKTLMTKFNVDMYASVRSAALAVLINKLIAYAHFVFFDGDSEKDIKLYEVRTRKIVTYSNILASCSNMAYVAATKDFKKLDIGGIIVTLYRLFNDIEFIRKLKHEFVYGNFEQMVKGE